MKISKKKAYIFKMNLWTANIFSIAVFVIMAIITILLIGYTAIFQKPFILTLIIIYFAIHELLHGIGYFIGGTKLKNISYGIALEKGIFYCMGYQEITKKNILISLQMPFMVIGVITYIIGIIFKLRVLTWLSVFNIMGAAMDMAMFIFISGIKNVHYSESGKPNEFVLITSEISSQSMAAEVGFGYLLTFILAVDPSVSMNSGSGNLAASDVFPIPSTP